ncbi:glycosyltransferase, partial [Rosenbergiella nectarea]|uniref:glycosyltransferase n=1 Tax=Rosenbergiella nectarea TaxID=988801 RepID=UPI001F4D8F9B
SLECGFLINLFNAKNNFICSDHVSLSSFSKMKKKLKLNAYKYYTSIAVLTEADKKNLENENLFIPIKVIRNISSFNINNNIYKYKSNIVIAIGRLSYQKNFSRLIDIWCEMDTIGWELKIIGDGEDKINLLTKINKRNCNNINIINATKAIENYYKDAALLVMTSRYEGLPMVLIEAKSFGLPVIAFDCETGPKELICKDGVLVNYRDDKSYIKEFQFLLDNESVRKELSTNAKSNAEKYSPNYIIQEWKELLSD